MISFSAKQSAGLPKQVEALVEAIEQAEGRLSIEEIAFAQQVVAKVEGRLKHGTTHTLVALLGATGAGKSSVTNALVGSEIATTGVRRPTTSSTLACFWGDDDVQPLLDWLEVTNRHQVQPVGGASGELISDLSGLVLLDVPDHDSVAVAHRLEMERIAEHADLLLWVTDSEKYADKAMHDYLRTLGEHGTVTAMVLNKIDQLDEAAIDTCHKDLSRLLAADGLPAGPVIPLSANTGQGVDDLITLLAETVLKQRAVVDRLEADTRVAAKTLLDELGPPDGSNEIGKDIKEKLAAELVGGSGLGVVTEAVSAGHKRDAASRTGWPFTRWVRSLRPHPLRRLHLGQGSGGRATLPEASGVQVARSEAAVRNATRSVTEGLPQPWPDLIREAGTPNQAELTDKLELAVSESVRGHTQKKPHWWNAVGALQLALAAAALAGAVWLALLAFGAYLRIPEPPTPDFRGIPIPTGLLIGGAALGLIVAFIAARLASLGAKRRARSVRIEAERRVRTVSDELIIEPMQQELNRRQTLREHLSVAAG